MPRRTDKQTVPFAGQISLAKISVNKNGDTLIQAVDEALGRLIKEVADEATGDVGSLSIKLSLKSLGDGSVAIKPEMKVTPPKMHFGPRTAEIDSKGVVRAEGDAENLTFDDALARAARLEAQRKAELAAAKKAMLEGGESESHLRPVE